MLIEGTLDYAIFMLDKEGNVISWNSGAEKIFGYQENEIIEKNIATFFTLKDNQNNIYSIEHAWASDFDKDSCETYKKNISKI